MAIRSTPPSCCCICHYRRRVPCNRLTFYQKQCFVGKLHGTSSTQTTRVRLRVSFPKCNADIHIAYRPPLTSAIARRQQQLAEPNDAWSRWGDARRRHSPTCRLAGSLTVNLNRMVATSTFHFGQRKGFSWWTWAGDGCAGQQLGMARLIMLIGWERRRAAPSPTRIKSADQKRK